MIRKIPSQARILGPLLCLVSAFGYSACNMCLRAVSDLDAFWVSCIKTVPTLIMVTPWFIAKYLGQEPIFPRWSVVGVLIGAGLLGQLGGNVAFQWSLGVVGVAIAVPVTLGSMIVTGSLLSWVWLREAVSLRMVGAITLLVIAIFVLSLGAAAGNHPANQRTAGAAKVDLWLLTGVVMVCVAGFSYGVLGVVIRYVTTETHTVMPTLFVTSAVGLVVLGAMAMFTSGVAVIRLTTAENWLWMLLAGAFNAAAFWALTKALQIATVTYVNALNTTQVAMCAIGGVVIFGEPVTIWLVIGVCLTTARMVLTKRKRKRPTNDQAIASSSAE